VRIGFSFVRRGVRIFGYSERIGAMPLVGADFCPHMVPIGPDKSLLPDRNPYAGSASGWTIVQRPLLERVVDHARGVATSVAVSSHAAVTSPR
jgi:hypothetical protein